jgi:Nitrate and nitrite sensing/Caspase domain
MPIQTNSARDRLALLIATSDYSDPALRQLRAPGRDASDLAEILSAPQIGGFSVQKLINARYGEILEAIDEFYADRHPDDQLLIYLSCHGVLDQRGRLYYAATNTRAHRLAATAVGAGWLNERLGDCRARSQIVILDCCHSGAFAGNTKGHPQLDLERRFKPGGRGRIVLTASRATEYSFEGGKPSGVGVRSVFTRAIVEGLRTGDADRDRDGLITVTDLYQYVYDRVRAAEPRQTPELWTYGAEGEMLLARSVRGAIVEPIPLPEDLRVTLESPRPRVRESGVAELAELLDTARPGLALSARQALQHISDKDNPQVSAVARVALNAIRGMAAREVRQELAKRDQHGQTDRAAGQILPGALRATSAVPAAPRQTHRSRPRPRKPPIVGKARRPSLLLPVSRQQLRIWLLVLITIPTAMVMAYGGDRAEAASHDADNYQRISQLAMLGGDVTELAQAMENERDITAGYIAAGRPTSGKSVVQTQWDTTDRWANTVRITANAITTAYPASTRVKAAAVIARISDLQGLRAAALASEIPAQPVITDYSHAIADLFALNDEIAQGSANSALTDSVRTLGSLSRMKDQASQQRGILYAALIARRFELGALDAFTAARSQEAADLAAFQMSATVPESQRFSDTVTGPQVDAALSMEQEAVLRASTAPLLIGTTGNAPPSQQWYSAMSDTINRMRQVEKDEVSSIVAQSRTLHNDATRSTLVNGVIVLPFVALALVGSTWALRTHRIVDKPFSQRPGQNGHGDDRSNPLSTGKMAVRGGPRSPSA